MSIITLLLRGGELYTVPRIELVIWTFHLLLYSIITYSFILLQPCPLSWFWGRPQPSGKDNISILSTSDSSSLWGSYCEPGSQSKPGGFRTARPRRRFGAWRHLRQRGHLGFPPASSWSLEPLLQWVQEVPSSPGAAQCPGGGVRGHRGIFGPNQGSTGRVWLCSCQ